MVSRIVGEEKMKSKSLPNRKSYPIATPINTYIVGFDILSCHYSKTKLYKNEDTSSARFQEYLFWRKNFVIWTCCTIESFVNLEGVSWLGEEFYKNAIEMQNIVQKIRLIYAIKYNKILPPNRVTLKSVKELFDLRNQFVHPKTRKVKDGNGGGQYFKKLVSLNPTKLKKLIVSVNSLIIPDPEKYNK